MKKQGEKKQGEKSNLQVILLLFYVASLTASNLIAAKMISIFGATVSAAFFAFPLTYILSDIFSEVYGYRFSRWSGALAITLNLFSVIIFQIAIFFPSTGGIVQESFKEVLGSTPRVLFASSLSFLLGDLLNDKIFRKLKEKSKGHKGYIPRALFSSLCGEFLDSLVFVPVAFLGKVPAGALVGMLFSMPVFKLMIEIVFSPLSHFAMKKVAEHEESLE